MACLHAHHTDNLVAGFYGLHIHFKIDAKAPFPLALNELSLLKGSRNQGFLHGRHQRPFPGQLNIRKESMRPIVLQNQKLGVILRPDIEIQIGMSQIRNKRQAGIQPFQHL